MRIERPFNEHTRPTHHKSMGGGTKRAVCSYGVNVHHAVRPTSVPRRRLSVKGRTDSARRTAPAGRRKLKTASPRPRILVIEDDSYAREALTLLLDYYGYEVTAASNGDDGLALVTEAEPDLVVTDWRMPGLSGLALCTALRQRRGTMPIVVVTSADEVFSSDQPVNARLRKPIDPPLLNRVITDELRTQRRAQPH